MHPTRILEKHTPTLRATPLKRGAKHAHAQAKSTKPGGSARGAANPVRPLRLPRLHPTSPRSKSP